MQETWALFLMAGLGIMMLAQIGAAALSFGVSPVKGVAALVVPGYLFVALRQTTYYLPVIALWAAGVLAVATGTIALS
ncbi:MAG TPA: hypothetical protein VGO76_13280 [Luteibacter sp.]|nr:hypothetical protein [Luteibacter sp.]